MALRLILGSSGSGKSRLLFDTVLKRAGEHPDRRFIVLVPEQFTLQTQRDLVELSSCGGILNIDVLSFTRLAYRVFEQTGVAHRSVLSETGKSLMLRLIAAREGEGLPFLAGILDRPGVIGELKSILSELDQYGITQDTLLELEDGLKKDGVRPALAGKLEEIRLLQEAFERYQADHFITGEKLPRVLCGKALLDPTLKGAELYLDGYTGFTPAQLDVLATLLPIVADLTVTVTIDPTEWELRAPDPVKALASCSPREYELFALSKRTIASLIMQAEDCGVPVEVPVILDGSVGRMKHAGELAWLEQHLLRPGTRGRRPYPGAAQSEGAQKEQILLRSCADSYDEAVSAAVTVKELVGKGMRYRDIAIVCGSLGEYVEYVKRVFTVYEIPFFIDRPSPVVLNPAFEFVESCIDVAEKNYSYESVMRLIRTGLILDMENGEADLLENYLIAAGIRGRKAWENPFTRKTKRGNEALQGAAECARLSFMEKFLPFSEVMRKGRVSFKDRAAALWQLIVACDVPGKMDALREKCEEDGRQDRAAEYGKVTSEIASVLDEACELIGAEMVTRTQFMDVLRAGFSEAKIGIIPPGIDEVHVGDLQRTRLEHIRAVLFLGLNDGYIPERKPKGGVLNDMEREYLRSRNVKLAPTAREDSNIQQFYLYLTLTKPSDLLVLSWSESKRDGSEMRSAPVVGAVRRLFPDKELLGSASKKPYYAVTSKRTGLRVLADGISSWLRSDDAFAQKQGNELRELLRIYENADGTWKEAVSSIFRAAAGEDVTASLDPETAAQLYGTLLHGSITRLEKQSQCPFRQFAEYGLGLREREEFTLAVPDIGELLHGAVEGLSRRMKHNEEGYTWDSIPDPVLGAWTQEALDHALAQHSPELYRDSERSRNTLDRCRRILTRSVRTIQAQVRAGAFVPARFEVEFSSDDEITGTGVLPSGARMRLRGRIDRIDECDDPDSGKLYVKIVDYKSASKKVDLDKLIDGEQLQLVVYMDEAVRMEQRAHSGRSVVCAGLFYYAMENPVLTADNVKGDTEAAMLKEMRLTGLVNESQDVLERLDRALMVPGATSSVVPVGLKQDGKATKHSSVLPEDKIEDLRLYSRQKMQQIAASIMRGDIRPFPSSDSTGRAVCPWCSYGDLCRFSETQKGMEYNIRKSRTEAEQWEIITQAIRPSDTDTEETGGTGNG